jgi:hypothetical protein
VYISKTQERTTSKGEENEKTTIVSFFLIFCVATQSEGSHEGREDLQENPSIN